MTVVVCGRTNLSDRAEAITRHLREERGFRTDGGCGRSFDLDDPLQHMRISRCLGCWRWLCQLCIVAHFAESDHDSMPSAPDPVRRQPPIGLAPHLAEEVTTDQTTPPMATTMQGAGQRGSRPRPTSNERREAAQV